MYLPNVTWSSERFLDHYGPYLKARLKAEPAATVFVTTVESAQDALREANERERAAARALQEAAALRDHAELAIVRTVRDFEVTLLAHVRKDRTSVTYRQYFPGGLRAFSRASREEQLQQVAHMETMFADATDIAPVHHFARLLADARTALEAALHGWRGAEDAHMVAQLHEESERARWLESHRSVYGGLIQLFPGDRERVEGFFRPIRVRRRDAAAPAA